MGLICAFYFAALFKQEAVTGAGLREMFNDCRFGLFIRTRDEIGWPFARDLQMFKLVKIAQ